MLVSIRIDKWLWAVRVFKTRTLAADACKSGKVKINEKQVKASRDIKVGDEIRIHQGVYSKTVRVSQVIKNRVSAKLAVDAVEDLTPQSEYDKLKMLHEVNYERRDRGIGRPTKKDQRTISKLKNKL